MLQQIITDKQQTETELGNSKNFNSKKTTQSNRLRLMKNQIFCNQIKSSEMMHAEIWARHEEKLFPVTTSDLKGWSYMLIRI